MAEQSKKITTWVFLLSLFIILAVIIIAWSYTLYKQTGEYGNTTTVAAIECVGYSFRIFPESIKYENRTLSFSIEPLGGGEFNSIVVSAGSQAYTTGSFDFRTTFRQPVRIKEISFDDTFNVSVTGCEENIINKCSISANRCEKIQ